jgi:hypothetical protein
MIDKINEIFKIPIYYNSNKTELKQNIFTDLELIATVDPSIEDNSIYDYVFNMNNNNNNDKNKTVAKTVSNQFAEHYTTDKQFLTANQYLLKQNFTFTLEENHTNILTVWNELKNENGFKEKYYYVEWGLLESLNKSESFLLAMSLYNLFSPVLCFLIPIIILCLPFLILKIKGLPININEYLIILKTLAMQHSLGKLFVVNYSELNTQEIIYTLVSAVFFLFTVYQNCGVLVKFLQNMKIIHSSFEIIKKYLNNTISNMNCYIQATTPINDYAHTTFTKLLSNKLSILTEIHNKLQSISAYNLNTRKIKEIGVILKYFYELHADKTYEDAIIYSLGFNGYIECIVGLQKNIKDKKMNYCEYINKTKKTVINNNYYACLKDQTPVKNNIILKKNMIITGPNASGKTTILKSVLINLILSQQIGCGFYESAFVMPFHYFHCYLNIPDTSGRDSLFQAEARRCKEILNSINDNADKSHLCVFDELYSGTNPVEAESTTKEFMEYIINKKFRVRTILTTHYVNVCKQLNKNENIKNYHMEIKQINPSDRIYTYKLKSGISEIKGAINILKQFNYPIEILNKLL